MRAVRTLALLLLGALAVVSLGGAAGAAPPPDPEAGRAVFAAKYCGRCHVARAAAKSGPALEVLRRPQGTMELAGRMWNHVPGMFAALAAEGIAWPTITPAEMAAIMTYLEADAARDPAPDVKKGEVTLMRKQCLKCHSLRREGGGVQPDLAQTALAYESPAAWAASMWSHTPRMAAMAKARGVPYPRFQGDEMANLIGFLRAAATAPPPGARPAPGR